MSPTIIGFATGMSFGELFSMSSGILCRLDWLNGRKNGFGLVLGKGRRQDRLPHSDRLDRTGRLERLGRLDWLERFDWFLIRAEDSCRIMEVPLGRRPRPV